jgi:hypothetical protein
MAAMVAGQDRVCIAIEQEHGLFGYPPELVSVGLRAIDEGKDADEAIDAYINRPLTPECAPPVTALQIAGMDSQLGALS